MNYLSKFTDQETALLISLPHKVGRWISDTDDTDGEGDDVAEEKSLTNVLQHIAKKHDEQSLVGQIVRQTLKSKDQWTQWDSQSYDVLAEIKAALPLVKKHGADGDVRLFKRALMEIGTTVAQASDEYGSFEDEPEGFLGKILSKFKPHSGGSKGHPSNVSAAEDSALARLRTVLLAKG
jgi:hypothetical protein